MTLVILLWKHYCQFYARLADTVVRMRPIFCTWSRHSSTVPGWRRGRSARAPPPSQCPRPPGLWAGSSHPAPASRASGCSLLACNTEPVFVNLLRSPGIHSQPGGPVRQPYLSYWLAESILGLPKRLQIRAQGNKGHGRLSKWKMKVTGIHEDKVLGEEKRRV